MSAEVTLSGDVPRWTTEQVAAWASQYGFEDMSTCVIEEEVNGSALLELTYENLIAKDGPFKLKGGPAKNIVKAIKQFLSSTAQAVPPVPSGPSSTPSAGELTFFERYVNSMNVGASTLDRAVKYFPARVSVVRTEEQARQLINDIAAIPESSTAKLMLEENNIIINGPLCPNLPTKSAFLYGFRGSPDGLSSHVIKIPTPKQVDHELNIWQNIQTLDYQGRFVPVELLLFKPGSHMVDIGGTTLVAKKAILMPIYPATLQHPPTIPDNFLYAIGNHVKDSLNMLHSLNIAHCDIKPPNLFLSPEGKVIIGDYGAAGPIGSSLEETSKHYLTEELLFSSVGGQRCKQIDYCMLAASLLEKRAQWNRTICTMADLRNRANTITHLDLKALINLLLDSADPQTQL